MANSKVENMLWFLNPTLEHIEAARGGDKDMQLSIIGYMSYEAFRSSDIKWLAPLTEDNNWDAMRIVITGATTLGFKSWKEVCDIKALKDKLINGCNKMDRNDVISICDDENLVLDKKCFFERARELKEEHQIYNYALYCAQGYPHMGIKQDIPFALLLFKEAAALGDESAKEVIERAEYQDDWYLDV